MKQAENWREKDLFDLSADNFPVFDHLPKVGSRIQVAVHDDVVHPPQSELDYQRHQQGIHLNLGQWILPLK